MEETLKPQTKELLCCQGIADEKAILSAKPQRK
jgi:hypothetical protein